MPYSVFHLLEKLTGFLQTYSSSQTLLAAVARSCRPSVLFIRSTFLIAAVSSSSELASGSTCQVVLRRDGGSLQESRRESTGWVTGIWEQYNLWDRDLYYIDPSWPVSLWTKYVWIKEFSHEIGNQYANYTIVLKACRTLLAQLNHFLHKVKVMSKVRLQQGQKSPDQLRIISQLY